MRKKIDDERLKETEGPMNAVALDDALTYLGLDYCTTLTPVEERALRAKKKKIVTSTKKQDRRAARELTKRANRFE